MRVKAVHSSLAARRLHGHCVKCNPTIVEDAKDTAVRKFTDDDSVRLRMCTADFWRESAFPLSDVCADASCERTGPMSAYPPASLLLRSRTLAFCIAWMTSR